MRRLLTLLLAAMAFVACTQNDAEELSANRADAPETLTVGFEGGDTRIELNEAVKTVWTEGDEVSVFYKTLTNIRGAFQGKTGDRQGNILLPQTELGDAVMDKYVVIYPYNEDYLLNAEALTLNAPIPATQSYKEGSYGENGNIMADASDATHVTLRSIYGWLRVHLTGAGEVVESITLRGNDGEQLAGYAQIDLNDYSVRFISESSEPENDMEVGGDLVFEDELITEITLDCGEGVELGAEESVFYIALLPQTFEKGVTIEVNYANSESQTHVYESVITIIRNHILPMLGKTEAIPNNQIWYTTTDGNTVEFSDEARYVPMVSNVYENGVGIITLEGEITSLHYNAFKNRANLKSVTLPASLTTIEHSVFAGCGSLEEVFIPENVKTIDVNVFGACSSLQHLEIPDGVETILSGCFNGSGLISLTIPDSVTTVGDGLFSGCIYLESVSFPDTITKIGSQCFDGCIKLREVKMGDGIESIDWAAFKDCSELESITLSSALKTIASAAFTECHKLKSIVIPNSVTEIGGGAFHHCWVLESITLSENISRIQYNTFFGCGLKSIVIPEGVTALDDGAFYGCSGMGSITLPTTLETIGEGVFFTCDALTTITIPERVTSIGDAILNNCNVTEVYCRPTTPPTAVRDEDSDKDWFLIANFFGNIPEGFTIYVPNDSVESYKTAYGWNQYADYIVGYDFETDEEKEVTTNQLWYTATALVEPYDANAFNVAIVSNEWDEATGEGIITFDGELTTIGGFAFYWCSSLTSVTIPDGVMTIGDFAFENCNLTSVTIPDSVTTIEWHAFYNCDSLTSVTIPDSVTSIRSMAFARCKSLTEFKGKFAADGGRCLIKDNTIIAYAEASGTTYTIPDSVTTIGERAFSGCGSLTSVTIPDSVTTIGDEAFAGCGSLTSVYCEATTPPTLGDSYVFDDNASGRKIYVPAASVEAYKTAENWSDYAADIVGYNFE